MRVIIFALCVAAAAALYDSAEMFASQAASSHAQAVDLASRLEASVANIPIRPQFDLQSFSANCQTAVTAFDNLFSDYTSCVYTSGSIYYYQLNSTQIASICTGSCKTTIANALAQVNAQCTSDADTAALRASTDGTLTWLDLANFMTSDNGLCVQDSGAYCFASYTTFMSATSSLATATTQQQMAQLCSPCMQKIMSAISVLASSGGQSVSTISLSALYCFQQDGQYCWPVVISSFSSMTGSTGVPDFGGLCQPCVIAWVRNAVAIEAGGFTTTTDIQAFGTLSALVQGFCTKDENGQYCGTRYSQAVSSFQSLAGQCPNNPTPGSGCVAGCKSGLTTAVNALGCCFNSIFQALAQMTAHEADFDMQAINNDNDLALQSGSAHSGSAAATGSSSSTNFQDVLDWIQGDCMITLAPPCSGVTVSAKAFLRNLLYSYYQANKDHIDLSVCADIANHFGVDPNSCTVDSGDQTSGIRMPGIRLMASSTAGVQISYTLVPDDSTHAAAIVASIQSGEQVALTTVSALPASARIDPSQPISYDASAAASTPVKNDVGGNGSGAALTGYSAPLLMAIAALAVAVNFF